MKIITFIKYFWPLIFSFTAAGLMVWDIFWKPNLSMGLASLLGAVTGWLALAGFFFSLGRSSESK